jgi:hypothetical protein
MIKMRRETRDAYSLLALKRSEETPKVRLVHVIIDFVTAHGKVEVVPEGGGHLKRGIIHRSRRWLYIYMSSLHPHHPSPFLPSLSSTTRLD